MANRKSNKAVFLGLVFLALGALIACGGPEIDVQPEEPVIQEPDKGGAPSEEFYFEHDGIKLHYDPQLVIDIAPPTESIQASSGDEMYDMPHPAYVHFNLYMEQAQVYVATVQEY